MLVLLALFVVRQVGFLVRRFALLSGTVCFGSCRRRIIGRFPRKEAGLGVCYHRLGWLFDCEEYRSL